MKLKIREAFQKFINKKNFIISITWGRQKGWQRITFLTAHNVMKIYRTNLYGQPWQRKLAKKDLRTISRLSLRGKDPKIIIDDFLAW